MSGLWFIVDLRINMKFDIPCVKNFLKENGFVFMVESEDTKDKFIEVEGIGKCWRKKIKEINNKIDLMDYAELSGFREIYLDKLKKYQGGIVKLSMDLWWQTIEKFCKGKPKWLYLVVKVE